MKFTKTALQKSKAEAEKWLSEKKNLAKINKHTPGKAAMLELTNQIRGQIVFPWDKEYNEARQEFDNIYEAFPIAIVYAICWDDIRACLKLVRDNKIKISIRSGGHSLANYSVSDGLVVDLTKMQTIHVNQADKTVTIDAGCCFENIFPIIEQYGLHMPGGDCPSVCVGGYMQGGGYGMTSRAYGMNCDNVKEVTVMLADGNIVIANESKNTDLYWAVRGGTGGNFGVVLNITYQLVSLGKVYGQQFKWVITKDAANAANVLYQIQENYLSNNIYPQLGIETVLTTDRDGKKKIFFCCLWNGTEAAFYKALKPMLAIPGIQKGPLLYDKYSKVNDGSLKDTPPDLPETARAYCRSAIIERNLKVNEWQDILQFFYNNAPNKYTMIDMEGYGGKINQIPAGTNAFIHRNGICDFFSDGFFTPETNDREANHQWITKLFDFMKKYCNGHSYQNYTNRDQENWRTAYFDAYYPYLVQVKYKYDPTNVFHYQQSIGSEKNAKKLTIDAKLLKKLPSLTQKIKYEKY